MAAVSLFKTLTSPFFPHYEKNQRGKRIHWIWALLVDKFKGMTGKWILAPATPHTPSPYPLTPQPQAPCSSSLQHLVWQTFTRNGSDGPETQHSLGSFLGRERTLACQLETTLAGIIFLPLFLFLSLFLSFCVWRGREDVKREKKKKPVMVLSYTWTQCFLSLPNAFSLSPSRSPAHTPHPQPERLPCISPCSPEHG